MHNGLKTVEKWLIRLVVIQFIVLIFSQVLMSQRELTPYLNKAVRHEGVIKPVKDMGTESVDQPVMLWYHNNG